MNATLAISLIEQRSIPEPTTGCWLWLGALTGDGYGHFASPGSKRVDKAHRLSYATFIGPIPAGTELDHLCRQRACVNPRHLEPVSHAVNVYRGQSFAAENVRKTHCPRGHKYDRILRSGARWCSTCERDHRRLQGEEIKRQRAERRAIATVRSLGGKWWLCLLCKEKFTGKDRWSGHGCTETVLP